MDGMLVIIEHDDGRRYAVDPHDFYEKPVLEGKTYERSGFRIVAWEDGSAYTREERTAYRAESATHHAEAVAKEETAAAAVDKPAAKTDEKGK